MFIGLSVLWGVFAVWGVATLVVRHLRLRARRERQAQSLALAMAELRRCRQMDEAVNLGTTPLPAFVPSHTRAVSDLSGFN